MIKSIVSKKNLLALAAVSVGALSASQGVLAHGTVTTPESRVWNCVNEYRSGALGAACDAAVSSPMGYNILFNWISILQLHANDNHTAVIEDGELCSASDAMFGGLDLLRSDWKATDVSEGELDVSWTYTAPANHDYIRYYITEEGYDPSQPLTFNGPNGINYGAAGEGAIFDSGPLQRAATDSHTITLPERTGKHVIYAVRQEATIYSGEAFYACIDVDFGEGSSND